MLIYVLLISTLAAVDSARRSVDKGFREIPKNASVILGSELTFRCAADAPDPEFDRMSQWRSNKGSMLGYDANTVLASSGGRYSYVQDSTEELHLHISNVELADDGVFECQMFRRSEGPIRSFAALNVLVPPADVYFEHYQISSVIEVNEDSALNITCVSKNAKPEPKLNWYVNGKSVSENIHRWIEYNSNGTATSYSALSWRPSKKDHNKLVTCEVQHPDTKTETRISLTMHVFYSSDRPQIDLLNKDQIKVGQNVTMVCLAENGNPPPRLTWVRDDRTIKTQYDYDFGTQITRNVLSFMAEGSDHNAVYECLSSNRENVPPLRSSMTVKVDYPPSTVSFVNVSTSVRKGDTIKLTCRSSLAAPTPIINWLLNGSPTRPMPQSEVRKAHGSYTESSINIDTNSLLSDIHQLSVDCTATNDEGSATKQQIIRILSPPMTPYIHNYGSNPMLEGELLNLTCESMGGNPLATLNWYRGVEKKHSKSAGNNHHKGHHKLRWKQLRDTQNFVDGNYSRSVATIQLDRSMNNNPVRCEASNPALDQPLNASLTLSVLYPPRVLDVRKLETDAEEMIAGQPTRLRCTVPTSNPVAEIHWEFETKNINKPYQLPGEQVFNRTSRDFGGFEVENIVNFVPTVEMDQTVVRCIASHPLWDKPVYKSYKLNIFYPPRIKVESPLTITVNEGDSFSENIAVESNPAIVRYLWRKNGVGFSDATGSIYVRGSTIGAQQIRREDAGTYLLVAANKFGSVDLTMRLIVHYGAFITHSTGAVFADVGEHVVLECQADAYPRRVGMVKWTKGGQTLESSDQDEKRAVLRVTATKENSGAYVCVADNGIAPANYTTSYLLIKSKPQIQRNQGHDRAAGPIKGRARLRCVANAVPLVAFYWNYETGTEIRHNSSKFQVTERQLDQTTFESVLYVNDLTEADYARRIRCRATNGLGSDYAFITIGPLSAPDVPDQISLLKYNSTSALVSWLPGFDGGSDQMFEVRYQSKDDKEPLNVNVSTTEVLLKDLKPARVYYTQVRAINAHGRSSVLSLPAIAIRTRAENGTEFMNDIEDGLFSPKFFTILVVVTGILFIVNVLLACVCHQRRKKHRAEKTEFVRRLNYGNDRRPLQLYGAIGANLSPAPMNRRPESNNTNKSELLNEQMSEDEQSVRTMIQVSPNAIQRQAQPNRFYDGNYIIDDSYDPTCYSVISKPPLPVDHTATLIQDPNYNKFAHGSPSLTYADIGADGTLQRRRIPPDSPRRMGSVTGSFSDSHRGFNTLGSTGTLPTRSQPPLSTFGPPRIVGNMDGDLV